MDRRLHTLLFSWGRVTGTRRDCRLFLNAYAQRLFDSALSQRPKEN